MKTPTLIIIILLFNSNGYGFSDSLNNNKWNKSHIVGFEAFGKLIYYDLFYEFGVKKNKFSYNVGYATNVYGIKHGARWGNSLYLKSTYGAKHKFTAALSFGITFDTDFFESKMSLKIKENPMVENYISTFSVGYQQQIKNSQFNWFFDVMVINVIGYNYEAPDFFTYFITTVPFGGTGLKYILK